MSYYENRIKALEERVAEMARDQRMKAIPVEAKLVENIARLQAEVERLRKHRNTLIELLDKAIEDLNAAKEGKQP